MAFHSYDFETAGREQGAQVTVATAQVEHAPPLPLGGKAAGKHHMAGVRARLIGVDDH
jgi:hypothetical protein